MSKSLSESKHQKTRRRDLIISLVWLVISLTGLSLLLFGSTPDRVGPLGITLLFILTFTGLISAGMVIRLLLSKRTGSTSLLMVILVAAAVTVGLAIGTIELQIGDVVLLGLFVLTFSIYWSKLR